MENHIELYAIDEHGRIIQTLSGDEQLVKLSRMPEMTYIDVPLPLEYIDVYWDGNHWVENQEVEDEEVEGEE